MRQAPIPLALSLSALLALGACDRDITLPTPEAPSFAKGGVPGAPTGGESVGNNLSYPVIWAEGVSKTLRGAPGVVNIGGDWVYWWGTDPTDEQVPLVCDPDPDDETLCDDGVSGSATGTDPYQAYGDALRKAFVQKDAANDWQAGTLIPTSPVVVDSIDWGDNLESVPWYINSRVRIETVLYDLIDPTSTALTEYVMRHTAGWGADEEWGLSVFPLTDVAEAIDNYFPTVYSNCARLTIQRLLVPRESPTLSNLVWDAASGAWTGTDPDTGDPLIASPIFNDGVFTVNDGPGYFNAEINVKGKIVYGYTWNVRRLNDGAGDYRITFSIDGVNCTANTDFVDGETGIMVPAEEEEVVISLEPAGDGGITYLDHARNLTYVDIHIFTKKGGSSPIGGGGGGGGGGGSSGGGSGGGSGPGGPR